MKAFGATVPGTKFSVEVFGCGCPPGKSVAKPGGAFAVELSTVAFPARARTPAGTVMPLKVKDAFSGSGWFGASGWPGLLAATLPGRVSSRRTGAPSGWKKSPPTPGGA